MASRPREDTTEDAWDVIKRYKDWFEPHFKKYLVSNQIRSPKFYPSGSTMSPECIDLITDLSLRGGKRQRVAFLCETVKLFDAKVEETKLLDAAISIELLQVHLLIHDDIFDNSPLRRGKPTTYAQYKQNYGEDNRLAISLSVLAGDIAAFLAIKTISSSKYLEQHEKTRISEIQLQAALDTFHGQIYDFERDKADSTDEESLYELADYKAVRSSTWAPMHIGLVLAGEDSDKNRKRVYEFARAVGVAGQLQDDYLGMFGDEDETGKSNESDIAEGKRTLLIQHTLSLCSDTERRKLLMAVGDGRVSNSQAKWVRTLVRKYKSDEYLIEKMKEWSVIARAEVDSWTDLNTQAREFFLATADWFMERKY